jgi:hypothetical protein
MHLLVLLRRGTSSKDKYQNSLASVHLKRFLDIVVQQSISLCFNTRATLQWPGESRYIFSSQAGVCTYFL